MCALTACLLRAMRVVQVTIQEGRFVILSHQRAEQAIAAHATQLTTELGDTAAELADVFGRLRSSLHVTSGDRDALKVGPGPALLVGCGNAAQACCALPCVLRPTTEQCVL